MLRFLACLLSLSGPAFAQDWAMRDGDRVVTRADLTERLVGNSIMFYDNGVSKFETDGRYSYTYDQGGTAYGRFEIGDQGIVCIDFVNGRSRCDRYVDNGERFLLLSADGYRFPIRP
jgi:hypothetical protein